MSDKCLEGKIVIKHKNHEITLNESDLPILAKLQTLGTISSNSIRDNNVGESDYPTKVIQPWSIWLEYNLNPFEADIIKRLLRYKKTDSRLQDYQKIEHIIKELIRQELTKNNKQQLNR